ncbi:P-loop containing nucleoside triphosphate hydrolase protein [Trichoderma gracile]
MAASGQSNEEPPDGNFDHLRTSKTSHRLNQIEKIRAHGVGDMVALPQLVVCGDQSAGKSSVLEGITGFAFPQKHGLCTRFPTEIILRHTDGKSIVRTASIRPHTSRPAEVQQTLSTYRKDIDDLSELPKIIEEVSKLMNIRGYSNKDDGHAFAPDALRIEVTGPIGLHLSVVDLPGLISNTTEEQTQEDVDAVHDMVTSYLESSRTIILAVLQAGNDMANQSIIKLARKHDTLGERTIGIITKPDLINDGTESMLARIANNQGNIKFKLGFFILKNPSPKQLEGGLSMSDRSKLEDEFFSSPPWATMGLNTDRVGVKKLRVYLQELLDTHIERELPKVRDDIRKLLASKEDELQFLGVARSSTDLIRTFLTSLSMSFYGLLQAALDGNYHGVDAGFFSNSDKSRLRACVQELNTEFAQYMRLSGRRRQVMDSKPDVGESTESQETNITSRLIVNEAEMMQWVKKAHSRTRGKELPGDYNSALLAELFLEQSCRWPGIAKSHVHSIVDLVANWIKLAVGNLHPEKSIETQIQAILQEWLEDAEKNALEELGKLVDDERRGPLTYNHYYTDNVQKARLDEQRKVAQDAVLAEKDYYGKILLDSSQKVKDFVEKLGPKIVVDMDQQACNEAITQLDAYYKVAMKTFIDNVARQVIERHILSPLPKAFCPTSVSLFSEEDLKRIASESEKQIDRREKLAAQVQGLKKSLRDLQKSV